MVHVLVGFKKYILHYKVSCELNKFFYVYGVGLIDRSSLLKQCGQLTIACKGP